MNVGVPTSKNVPVFRIGKVGLPVVRGAGFRLALLLQLARELRHWNDSHAASANAGCQPLIGGHNHPVAVLLNALGDDLVRLARAAEDDGHAAERLAEGRRLRSVERADDARPFRTRELREPADELAFCVHRLARDAESSEKIVAVDDPAHCGVCTATGVVPLRSAAGISPMALRASAAFA